MTDDKQRKSYEKPVLITRGVLTRVTALPKESGPI